MEDPQECPCGHVFCKDCIQQWLRSHSTCPNCRKHCHMIKPVLPMVRNLISHLTIRCENHQAGCEKRVQLEYYDNHKQTCDYASVPCPNEGCDIQVLRINMDDHRGVCDYHRETCLKGCGISILRKEQAGHSCILELKKKLEEQEREKRSLQQQNAELQTRVDNLKFLCWRSRNYLKKNMNTETPGTLHNLCVDLENATGLAPDNTEGHRDAAIPQASRQLHWSESDSSDIENIPPETSPESSLFQPTAESSPYQPSPANSPPHTIDSPNEYQPSPANSPPRPIGSLSLYHIDSPDEYQPSPANSPSHHIPSDGEDENEEGGQGNTHSDAGIATNTAETNAEESNADRGEVQPQERTRAEGMEHRTQGSTQANSRGTESERFSEDEESRGTESETFSEDEESRGTESETFSEDEESRSRENETVSEDEESTIESDSSEEAESSSDHSENLRYLLASDSDLTYDEDSPSESETAPTDQNVNRRSTNVHVESGSSQQNSQHDRSETTGGTQRATTSTSNSRRLSYGGGLGPYSSRSGTSNSRSGRLSYGGGLSLPLYSPISGTSNSRSKRLRHGGGLAVGLDSSRSGTVQNSTTSTQQNSQNSSERTADQRAPAASTSDTRMVRQRRGLHYEPDSPRSGTVQNSTTSTQQNSQNRSETALNQRAPISTSVTRMVRFRRGLHYEPDSPRSGTEQDSTAGSTQQNSQNRSERTATDQRAPVSTSNTRMLRRRRGLAFEPDPPNNDTVQSSTTSTQQNSQNRSKTTVESEQVRSRQENACPASNRLEDTVLVEDSEEVGDNADGPR
ncbi:serine/arginine repetitive matrix protein 2-like [Branchiostoma floridae]|uniref:Serine/arginine repetitive matrix protein 2-like n=1 Tax=Branchiostoma floridae TaxID=7739 RepID=A0A9J7M6U4_BRAFL|nr:serine/arginine repetitive matrix protein 2-like [Branchiostoma floridae]